MTLPLWWLPLAAAAIVVWAALLWPFLAREHAARGHALAAVSVLAVAVVTPFTLVAGPHFDPRQVVDPATVVYPAWVTWNGQVVRLLLIGCLFVVATTKIRRRHVGGGLVVALAAFTGVGLLSAAVNGNGMRPALLAALTVAPAIVFWASNAGWADTVPVLRWALRITVLPSLALAAGGPDWAYWPADFGRTLFGVPQLVGVTEHPNALGPAAAMLLVLEVAKPRRRRWQCWAVGAGLVLLLTQSRTAWMAIAVAALFAAAASREGWRRWLVGTGVGVLLLWLRAAPPDVDFTGRPAVWVYAWRVFRAHPLLGDGPGFLESASRKGLLPPSLGWMPRHAHDQVLHVAATTGAIGLITLVVLLVGLAVGAGRAAKTTGGASAALFGVLVTRCVTEVPLSTGVTGFLLNLVLFAVVFAGLRDRRPTDAPTVEIDDREECRAAII